MLGLTRQEKTVIVFLILMALLGLIVRSVKLMRSQVSLQVVPSELTPEEKDVDDLLRQAKIVNINQDPVEKIITLPGIGPALAERIVEYRQVHGSYKKIEELLNVPGIGPKKLEKIKEFVVVD